MSKYASAEAEQYANHMQQKCLFSIRVAMEFRLKWNVKVNLEIFAQEKQPKSAEENKISYNKIANICHSGSTVSIDSHNFKDITKWE